MDEAREFDLVLLGATGFTGGLTADYLAKHAPEGLRWALAGRSLERLKKTCEAINMPGLAQIEARADDPASLARMASKTRVLATTVGPYARFGAAVVDACVTSRTDYVDITGEPAFVADSIRRHDADAQRHGLRIVHCCGFDSVPHDLGALMTARALPPGVPMVIEGLVYGEGTFSGGTWRSAIEAMGGARRARNARLPKSAHAGGRRVRGLPPRIRYEKTVGAWLAPLPTIDPQIVLRSAAVLDDFGPDFRYGHYVRVRSLPKLVAGLGFVGSVVTLAQTGPTRRMLLRLRRPGEGPSAEQRARGRFSVVFVGTAGNERVVTEVSGGDPGYGETAKMLAESALCLIDDRDRLPAAAGVLTPAVAFGSVLIERLRAAGMTFEVVDS